MNYQPTEYVDICGQNGMWYDSWIYRPWKITIFNQGNLGLSLNMMGRPPKSPRFRQSIWLSIQAQSTFWDKSTWLALPRGDDTASSGAIQTIYWFMVKGDVQLGCEEHRLWTPLRSLPDSWNILRRGENIFESYSDPKEWKGSAPVLCLCS